ncbi:MAG TPA: 3-hydroxyacyl-CoA dehydrogenase family protein [bacterium]|nr:3-hydroxyacyl-CoA dehydrogenase family protein [bacterium]
MEKNQEYQGGVLIVGAGMMGCDIASWVAANNYLTAIVDRDQSRLAVVADKLAAYQIQLFTNIESAANQWAGRKLIVIETVNEDREIKGEVFKQLSSCFSPTATILASNSSAICVSELEAYLTNSQFKSRLVNMHFYPPIKQRPLVELMRGTGTTEQTLAEAEHFVWSLGLTPIIARAENPGLVFNFIWQAIKRAALELIDRGVSVPADIDLAWRIAMNMSVGPCQTMDMVGLDVVLSVFQQHHEQPPQCLVELVTAGKLGRKTGEGFYQY